MDGRYFFGFFAAVIVAVAGFLVCVLYLNHIEQMACIERGGTHVQGLCLYGLSRGE